MNGFAPIAPLETGFDFRSVVMAALYVPFLSWGIHLLRRRFRRHAPLAWPLQAATVAGVLGFAYLQIELLGDWLVHAPLKYLGAILGVFVAAAVLYGHVVVSLLSHAVVALIMPLGAYEHRGPDFRVIHDLERKGDLEGLEHAYESLRIQHPRDPSVLNGLADVLLRLDKPTEAAACIEQALEAMSTGDASVMQALRLAEIYERRLGKPYRARLALQQYLDRHPQTPRGEAVERRLSALGSAGAEEDGQKTSG